jgi:hypothetical protein
LLTAIIAVLLLFAGHVFDMANATANVSTPQAIAGGTATGDTKMP